MFLLGPELGPALEPKLVSQNQGGRQTDTYLYPYKEGHLGQKLLALSR